MRRETNLNEAAEAARTTAEAAARAGRNGGDQVADAARTTARAGADATQRIAGAAQDSFQSGLNTAAELTQRSFDQFSRLWGLSGVGNGAAEGPARNVEALGQAGTELAQGFQEISRECLTLAQERLRKNIEGFNALLRCRDVQEFVTLQSELVRDNLERTVNNSRRIWELSARVANQATQKVAAQTNETVDRARRAA
jgi:phasin family protein